MKKTSLSSTSAAVRTQGFSLVEVAMAVAIAALGVVVILGVIPGGLESIRRAGNTSAEARIVSQIIGELQLSDWQGGRSGAAPASPVSMPGLLALTSKKWYFDDQAAPLDEDDAALQTNLTYVARVRFSPSGGGLVIPPGGNTSMLSTAAVIVDLAAVPIPNFDFDDRDRAAMVSSHPVIITRQF